MGTRDEHHDRVRRPSRRGPASGRWGTGGSWEAYVPTRRGSQFMEHRYLGRSGLLISEIAYGNWLTHGSQVEEDAAVACVRAALDAGITTFDTADVYAETRAEAAGRPTTCLASGPVLRFPNLSRQ